MRFLLSENSGGTDAEPQGGASEAAESPSG